MLIKEIIDSKNERENQLAIGILSQLYKPKSMTIRATRNGATLDVWNKSYQIGYKKAMVY